MFYLLLFTSLFISTYTGYVYRRLLMRMLFKLMFKLITTIVRLYTYYNKRSDKVKRLKYLQLGDKYALDEYNVINNDKTYHVILVGRSNNKLYQDIIHFKKDVSNNLDNRNVIVHCSITNNNNDIVIDITEIFRRFVFYFNNEGSDINIDVLAIYINHKYNNVVDENEHNLTIYMNDNCFTEYIYPLKDISNDTFYNILNREVPLT